MQEKPPSCNVKFFRWFPVLFVVGVIGWSYYAYAVYMCFYAVTNQIERIIYLVFSHILILLLCVSFLRAIFTPLATVPKEFFLTEDELAVVNKNKEGLREIVDKKAVKLQVQARTNKGKFRYCELCNCVKPDRSHHCSSCEHCVLKMDHHCPWINNCVHFNNYKFFFLFLLYTLLCSLFVVATSLQYVINFWNGLVKHDEVVWMQLNYVILFFITSVLLLCLGLFLATHCNFIGKNHTTLESMRTPIFRSGPDKNAYNRGCKLNFEEVFGKVKWKWFLPIPSELGDGVTFLARISPPPYNYQSIDSSTMTKIDITPVMVQPVSDNNSFLKSKLEGSLYNSIPMNDLKLEEQGKFM